MKLEVQVQLMVIQTMKIIRVNHHRIHMMIDKKKEEEEKSN